MASILKKPLKTYKVRIGDCNLNLKTNHNLGTLDEIIKVVEQKILASKEHNPTLSVQKTFALCCFNVAEELVYLKQVVRRQLDSLESSTQFVLSELQSSSKDLSK